MSHEEFPTSDPAVVTCGLPYANGDLHIGHMRTYISGDVYSRALSLLGQETAFVCGSDMHGTPVAVNAWREGISPEEFALRWHEKYEETFPRFDVAFDNYGHTHDETNTGLTREIVRTLDDEGYIYEKEIQVAWDPVEEQALPDRYVEGTCPYCGEKARGDECDEGCQRHLEPGEIEDPRSVITGNRAEYRERSHKFFRISDFQGYLQEFINRLEGTDNAKNQPREWIEGELQDWCITRDLDWGIRYPGEEEEGIVLYVWVDAPIEYISSTKQYSERVGSESYDWEDAWKRDGEIVHVIGRDIIQHHAVFWPSMLHGAGYAEPRAIMASGFVNLQGQAFSTSRNRAIWVDDYLDEGFAPGLLRYYLVSSGEFQSDIDFSWERFQEVINGELVGNVGNFLYRTLLFAYRNWEGTPPGDVSPDVMDRIEEAIRDFEAGVNAYSIRAVATAGVSLARFGNEYIQQEEPWRLLDESPEEAAQVIRDCVQLTKAISVLLYPVLPRKTTDLWTQLGETRSLGEVHIEEALEPPADSFDEPSELFDRLEDERVDELNETLEARIEAAGSSTEDEEDEGEEIASISENRVSFDAFEELDIRVGKIVSAESIEDSTELVKLDVDLGVETRQVVAGIQQLHDVDSLPGTEVIVLANIEKTELFGVESNGMVLAAGEDADLLRTHDGSPPGTRVR